MSTIRLRPIAERIAFHQGAIATLELLQKIGISKANVEMNLAINKTLKTVIEDEAYFGY